MTTPREFTVALLMEDPSCAREVSAALRQAGVFAHYYSELDEFWMAVKMQMPDLAIVDVAKMSFGDTQFKDHPLVRDGSMATVFFHRDETRFLLNSALTLPSYGFIHGDIGLVPQVLALVNRRRKEIGLEQKAQELEDRVNRLQARSVRLIGERSHTEQFKSYFEFITTLAREVTEEARTTDFVSALFGRLSDWLPVRNVGLYELAPNRQKLVSPALQRKKWIGLPSLWIGKDCVNGIESFAIDMGWQVARDVFETEPVEIRLFGVGTHPDLLLYLEVDRERVQEFPWELLASNLSGVWRQWRLSRQQPRPSLQLRPVWEALEMLDQLHYHQVESGEKVLLLSFTPLLGMVKKKTGNRFNYTPFYNEFFLQLGAAVHETTQFSFCGPWHILLFVKAPFLEREHARLSDLLVSFPFWRFFEDESRVMGEEARPTLKTLAPSAVNYLRQLEREFDELPILEAQAKLGVRLKSSTPPRPQI